MLCTRTVTKQVANTETTVFTFAGLNGASAIFVENQDSANFIQYVVKSSTDGVNYGLLEESDTAVGVTGIITPTQQAVILLKAPTPYVRLVATAPGGAMLQTSVAHFAPSSATNFIPGVL